MKKATLALVIVFAILLTACYNDTANSGDDGRNSVTVDAPSSEPLPAKAGEDLDAASESSSTESNEDETPEPFVELTPFDINENEYRFTVGYTEYVIDLSYYDSTSLIEFDALEEPEYKKDIVNIEKRSVTSAKESSDYGMEIFREYLINTEANKTEWLLLGVMRDETNDAWGLCFAPAPLSPGYEFRITYYSDGEMISFGVCGE